MVQHVDGVGEGSTDVVYSIPNLFGMFDRKALHQYPLEVLSYAARHGYTQLMDNTARLAIGMGTKDVMTKLHPSLYLAWVSIRSCLVCAILTASNSSSNTTKSGQMHCWPHTVGQIQTCIGIHNRVSLCGA